MHAAASSSHAGAVPQRAETLDSAPLRVGALDSAALARRLGELAGDERDVQVDFLFHLDAFDRRRGFLDAGYASLWEFCQRALHLREGAAGRRISAMRVLRRFPVLEGALREGRLCLSTVALLGPVLTPENLEVVVGQAAFRTRAEVDRLVASLQPRAAPKDGLRRVAARPEGQRDSSSSLAVSLCSPAIPLSSLAVPLSPEVPLPAVLSPAVPLSSPAVRPLFSTPAAREVAAEGGQEARAPSRPEIRPVSADSYSLRVTVDTAFKDDLETLRCLLSHKVPSGNLAAVLREAVRCGIEKHGKRRGAVAPLRKVGAKRRELQGAHAVLPAVAAATSQALSDHSATPGRETRTIPTLSSGEPGPAKHGERTAATNESQPSTGGPPRNESQPMRESAPRKENQRRTESQPRIASSPEPRAEECQAEVAGNRRVSRAPIPAAVRREVWTRDGGQCAWRGDDGRRCESRWQLEFDHVVPVALGGPSTAGNVRMTCRVHNLLSAEQVFGPEHMARFRRGTALPGEIAIASGGAP